MHLEIACDESGFSGGNLVGRGHSPVFAHASIRIDSDTASQLIQHLRHEIGARGEGEYKSAEILRPRRRSIVLWLLGPTSPSTATRMFISPTPDSSSLRAWSTCCSAVRQCVASPAQAATAIADG